MRKSKLKIFLFVPRSSFRIKIIISKKNLLRNVRFSFLRLSNFILMFPNFRWRNEKKAISVIVFFKTIYFPFSWITWVFFSSNALDQNVSSERSLLLFDVVSMDFYENVRSSKKRQKPYEIRRKGSRFFMPLLAKGR